MTPRITESDGHIPSPPLQSLGRIDPVTPKGGRVFPFAELRNAISGVRIRSSVPTFVGEPGCAFEPSP